MDKKINMGALGLRDTHEAINAVILPRISDESEVETAMTKTEEGYVYEIRYKEMRKGMPWRAELPVDQEAMKKIMENVGNNTTSTL